MRWSDVRVHTNLKRSDRLKEREEAIFDQFSRRQGYVAGVSRCSQCKVISYAGQGSYSLRLLRICP